MCFDVVIGFSIGAFKSTQVPSGRSIGYDRVATGSLISYSLLGVEYGLGLI